MIEDNEYDYLKITHFEWVSLREAVITIETLDDETEKTITLRGMIDIQEEEEDDR